MRLSHVKNNVFMRNTKKRPLSLNNTQIFKYWVHKDDDVLYEVHHMNVDIKSTRCHVTLYNDEYHVQQHFKLSMDNRYTYRSKPTCFEHLPALIYEDIEGYCEDLEQSYIKLKKNLSTYEKQVNNARKNFKHLHTMYSDMLEKHSDVFI